MHLQRCPFADEGEPTLCLCHVFSSVASPIQVSPSASVEVRNMVKPGNKCGALFMTMSLKVRGGRVKCK